VFYGENIFEQEDIHGLDSDSEAHKLEKMDPYEILKPGPRDKVVLSVLDNGIGIKKRDQPNLFQLFGCLKTTRTMNS